MSGYLPEFNWIDIFLIILIIRTTYTGFARGLVFELITIVGIAAIGLLAIHNYTHLGEFFKKDLNLPEDFSNFISFVILGSGVYLIFRYVREAAYRFFRLEMYPSVQKIGGAILGFSRGALTGSILLLGLLLMQRPNLNVDIKHNSFAGPAVLKLVPVTYDYILGLFPKYEETEKNQLVKEVLSHEPRDGKVKSHLKRKQPKKTQTVK